MLYTIPCMLHSLFCIRRVTQKVKKYHFRVITSGGSELLK
jgi:hypothetical protein